MKTNLITNDRRFWPLFWTQFLGAFNDNIYKNALVMLITFKSVQVFGLDAKSLVALSGGIFILPFLIFSAIAGQVADKFPKHKVIRVTKYTELLFMLLAVVGFTTDSFAFLIFVLFLMGAQSAFFGPLKYGVIPELVKSDELVKANAFVSLGTFVAILMGTILGGVFASGDVPSYLLPIAVAGIALIGIVTSQKIIETPAKEESIKLDFTLIKPTWNILKITKEDRKVFHYVLSISWYWFLGAAILSLIPPVVKDILMGNESVGTLFLALFTVGMGVGSICTEKISGGKADVGVVNFGFVIMSLALFDLSYSISNWSLGPLAQTPLAIQEFLKSNYSLRIMLDMFVLSFAGGAYIVTLYSLIQLNADKKKMARVVAGNNIWNAVFMVLAAVSLMIMHSLGVSMAKIFIILGALNLGAGLLFYLQDGYWAWRFLFHLGISLKYKLVVHGKENIPEDGSYVVICNHQSFVDWGVLMSIFRRPLRFVIDHLYYNMKMLTWLFKTGELVPIATRKENEDILNNAYKMISDHLNNNQLVLIFPEGWLTSNGELKKFQPGLQRILKDNPVQVIPVTIVGLWGSWTSRSGKGAFKGLPSFKRRELHIYISKAMQAHEYDPIGTREQMSLLLNQGPVSIDAVRLPS